MGQMSILNNLQPTSVFRFFEEICSIPHTSFHEKQLSDYCVKFAKDRSLFCKQDSMGNVIIIKEATLGYESVEPIMIQGHLDMVGAKTEDCETDLEKDGLTLLVEGDFIRADRTTLGADDGIAVAYALALLDANDISHPRLEIVLTVSEEVGLLGASAIDLSVCKAKRLINIDSEEEGIITAGCAGGRRNYIYIPVERTFAQGILVQLQVEGLKGGHSGMEIHKGRANANVLLGRLLYLMKKNFSFHLVKLSGGVKENVIPSMAKCQILVEEKDLSLLKTILEVFHIKMQQEHANTDPDIHVVSQEVSLGAEKVLLGDEFIDGKALSEKIPNLRYFTFTEVLTEDSLCRILQVMNLHPNGVQAMSADLEGLVETSLNLGVVELTTDALILKSSIRSSVTSAKVYLADKLTMLAQMAGGTISFSGDYPAWPYARESKLRDICVDVFEKQYGRKPEITVIHAGLECGILSSKIEGLDCVSIGPNLFDIHSPKEKVSISSVQRVWEYVKQVLAVK